MWRPLLGEPWILDVDSTVKPVGGHQEGAEISYNPKKPGRPSHVYHSSMIAEPRLILDVEVEAGNRHELTDGFEAERVVGEWIGFYNTVRPHSALAGRTPAEAYGVGQPVDMMDNASALPTSPPAQQQQQDVINRILAA